MRTRLEIFPLAHTSYVIYPASSATTLDAIVCLQESMHHETYGGIWSSMTGKSRTNASIAIAAIDEVITLRSIKM
jgi:hypothetical protein